MESELSRTHLREIIDNARRAMHIANTEFGYQHFFAIAEYLDIVPVAPCDHDMKTMLHLRLKSAVEHYLDVGRYSEIKDLMSRSWSIQDAVTSALVDKSAGNEI